MELLESIKAGGVVGAGGAGFPTHIKLNAKVDTLIINAAECEPLLETDKYLMRHATEALIEGIEIVGLQLGVNRKVIGLKEKYHNEIKRLQEVITEKGYNIEIYLSRNFYPTGDEQILVKEIIGKSIPEGGIPLDVGVVVSNVTTIINVYEAQKNKPVISKIITITGEVKNPILLEVPIGVSIKRCIEMAGETSIVDYSVILGGPMMGEVIFKEDIANRYVTKTLGAIIVLPQDHHIFNVNKTTISTAIARASSACIQCRMCTDLCPRYLIGHNLNPHKIMRAIGSGEKNLDVYKEALLCCECGICEMYACPMGLSPKTVNQHIKKLFSGKGIRFEKKIDKTCEAHEMREYRKVQTDRLIARLGLSKYQNIHLDDLIKYEVVKGEILSINTKQHIGVRSIPSVKVGDTVLIGDCIAQIPENALGANIHSSISGEVIEVNENIKIKFTYQMECLDDKNIRRD